MVPLHFLLPGLGLIPSPWNLLGILPLVAGVTISTLAERQFHQAKTTVKPFIPATTLVTEGFFSYSRNPMYLGFVLALLGIAILFGSLTPFLVIPIFIAIIQHQFIRVEESMMQETFGNAWLVYTQKTRRWL
jgi:protein-S-isoprenylcysteine O-methyltransferase Ste14